MEDGEIDNLELAPDEFIVDGDSEYEHKHEERVRDIAKAKAKAKWAKERKGPYRCCKRCSYCW